MRLALIFVAAGILFGQPQYTQIQDTLYTPVLGDAFNGTVKISAPVQVNVTTVGAWIATKQISNGALNISLAVNQPGTQYILLFTTYTGAQWNAACQVAYSPTPVLLSTYCQVQGLPQSAPTSGVIPGSLTVGGTASFGPGTGYGCLHLHDPTGVNDTTLCGGFGTYNINLPASTYTTEGEVMAVSLSTGNLFWVGLPGIGGVLSPAQMPAFLGDVVNTISPLQMTVARIAGHPVNPAVPTTGQVLTWSGTAWYPADGGSSACPTCVTSASVLTNNALMKGAGLQAAQTSATVNLLNGAFYPTADSATAIQFENAAQSATILNIDTSSGHVGIGGAADPNGVLQVNGNAYVSTSVSAQQLRAIGTRPTLSGCSAGTQTGGAFAGTYTSGTSGTCTVTVTFSVAAPTGWACSVWDITTATDAQKQFTSSQSAVVFTGTTVSGDVIQFGCLAF